MTYRLDFTVIEKAKGYCRYALSLHNLTDQALHGWSLYFFVSRCIDPASISVGTISQMGSYSCLSQLPPLEANGHFYTEFTMRTLPFNLHDDGINEAFIALDNDQDQIQPLKVHTTAINLDKDPIERYCTPLPSVGCDIALIPQPNHLIRLQGEFVFDQTTAINTPPALAQGAINWLSAEFKKYFNEAIPIRCQGNIHYQVSDEVIEHGYQLLIESDNIWIQASSATGFVLYMQHRVYYNSYPINQAIMQ
jgi:hexosaminidase